MPILGVGGGVDLVDQLRRFEPQLGLPLTGQGLVCLLSRGVAGPQADTLFLEGASAEGSPADVVVVGLL